MLMLMYVGRGRAYQGSSNAIPPPWLAAPLDGARTRDTPSFSTGGSDLSWVSRGLRLFFGDPLTRTSTTLSFSNDELRCSGRLHKKRDGKEHVG